MVAALRSTAPSFPSSMVWYISTNALATLLLQPFDDLPDAIIIDEPELGLHPHAIEIIAGLVRSVSHQTQVILATQSTAFVDHFTPEEIVVAEIDRGCSQFRRLDSTELTDWLEDYSVGQLWEKNVLAQVYKDIRALPEPAVAAQVAVLERRLQMSLAEIESDWDAWFRTREEPTYWLSLKPVIRQEVARLNGPPW